MRIRDVELRPFAIPFRTPLATARGPIAVRAGLVVRLVADDGAEGIGEAAPHPHAPPSALARLRDELVAAASRLRGAALARADELIDEAGTCGGAAAMGVDMALHDLVARWRGVSVAELLGGMCRPVEASALLEGDVVAGARAASAAGFRVAKLKASPDAEATLAMLADVARAAPGLALRVDANGAWDVARARRVMRALDPARLAWLEQPVPATDPGMLADVRRHARALGHRIAADECVRGPDDVRRIADLAAADVVVVKLVQVGGLRRAVATVRAAHEAGLEAVVTTGLETSLGTAAALQLASALASCGRATPPAGIATAGLLAGDLVTQSLPAVPSMTPPPGPGLGVTLAPRSGAAAEYGAPFGGVA